MPSKTWDTKADFDAAYDIGAEGLYGHPSTRPEVRLHYHRSVMGNSAQRIADHFTTYLTAANFNRRLVIVGGGFGWVADELKKRGFTNVVVVDTSPYIQAEKDSDDDAEIRAEIAEVGLNPDFGRGFTLLLQHKTMGPRRGTINILNEEISTTAGRNAIKAAVNGNPQIVVTEDVMTSFMDAECVQLDADCNAFSGQQRVAHMVTVGRFDGSQDLGYNWKTLVDWKLLIPGTTWINRVTGEVLE